MAKHKVSTSSISLGFTTGSTSSLTARWSVTGSWKSAISKYRTNWKYAIDGKWYKIVKQHATVGTPIDIYSIPSGATTVKFRVFPVPKTNSKTKKKRFTGVWSDWVSINLKQFSGIIPENISGELNWDEGYLKLISDNTSFQINYLQFQLVKATIGSDKSLTITEVPLGDGIDVLKVDPVSRYCEVFYRELEKSTRYRIRARSCDKTGTMTSEWSEYTEWYTTPPDPPVGVNVSVTLEKKILLEWEENAVADGYGIQYSENIDFQEPTDVTTLVPHYEFGNLELGKTYYFRVNVAYDNAASGWSETLPFVFGRKPAAPSTWSSEINCRVGVTDLNLYWVHNSADNSSETKADVEITYDDGITQDTEIITIENDYDFYDKDKTKFYNIPSENLDRSMNISWRVRTYGILDEPSDWSEMREVKVYANPIFSVEMTNIDGEDIVEGKTIATLPIKVKMDTTDEIVQQAIAYSITVTVAEEFSMEDEYGMGHLYQAGQEIFVKNYTAEAVDSHHVSDVELTYEDISLEDGQQYNFSFKVYMNSGITSEVLYGPFEVHWPPLFESDNDMIDAIFTYHPETYSMEIHPYAATVIYPEIEDPDEDPDPISVDILPDIVFDIYRREFDGSLTMVGKNLPNTETYSIVDPHPALDFGRYRVIAKRVTTGQMDSYDAPPEPIAEKAVVISWNEMYRPFDLVEDAEYDLPYEAAFTVLPYNIDVSENNELDVSFVKYIGRRNPVSYYGTQIGYTADWSVDIPASDVDTLYELRRLAVWPGNVYVREPSGTGYWASIKVSFTMTHRSVVIPVKLSLTRVEGST